MRDAGERLDGVGQQTQIARVDAFDGDGAGDAEEQGLVGAVQGVDALEPGVPRGFGELSPNCRRDLRPKVICRWSAHADSPIVHSYVHTCGEATAHRLGRGYSDGRGYAVHLALGVGLDQFV